MAYSIVVTLFIASIGILRIQAKSDEFEGYITLLERMDDERHIAGLTEAPIYNVSKNGVRERNHTRPIVSYESVIRQNNKYGPNEGKTLGGPKISSINNHFFNNPYLRNIYESLLIKENNTYTRKNASAKYEPVVRKIGNIYPENPGKNDIHNPNVIRSNNNYIAYSPEDSLINKQPSLSFDKSVYNFLCISILCSLFYNK